MKKTTLTFFCAAICAMFAQSAMAQSNKDNKANDKPVFSKRFCAQGYCLLDSLSELPLEKVVNAYERKEASTRLQTHPVCRPDTQTVLVAAEPGKSVILTYQAVPLRKEQHYALTSIIVKADGAYTEDQVKTVLKDLAARSQLVEDYSYNKVVTMSMGLYEQQAKLSYGQTHFQLTVGRGGNGMTVAFIVSLPSQANKLAAQPGCAAATPSF